MINDLLKNKTARERASIKAKKVAKLSHSGLYESSKYGVKVEIKDFKEIEGGVELLARAWKGTEQVGFGEDGSVEWERFRIFNPPILVDDPTGDIVRTSIDPDTGEKTERKLREDPVEAIRQVIAHNITLVGKDGTNVKEGKIGHTTSTFYPNEDPETESVDGHVTRANVTNETISTIVNGDGTADSNDSGTTMQVSLFAHTTSNRYRILFRMVTLFDTSAIPDTDTISSAVISLKPTGVADQLGGNSVGVVSTNPASNTALATGDYAVAEWGTTRFASDKTLASMSAGTYADWTLNASGLAAISKTGISKFGFRIDDDIDITDVPTWSSNLKAQLIVNSADASGTTDDPKLVVVHSAASSIKTITGIAKASVKTVNGVAIASVKTINGIA